MKKIDHACNRRRFLQRCLHVATGSAGMLAMQSRMQLALAQTPATNDYKALVCVFLFGGNDSYNMVVPRSNNEYQIYQQVRQNLAISQADILPLNPKNTGTAEYGLHPAMASAQQLFADGRLAILANAGALIEPVSKSDYQNRSVRVPPQLFSHNDQQNFSQALGNNNTGWAGRAADIMQSLNINDRLSMNISLGGSNIWQSGEHVFPYSISGEGVETFEYFNQDSDNVTRAEVFQSLMQSANTHVFQREYAAIQQRAWALSGELIAALGEQAELGTAFPQSRLATDLKMVARMISARDALNVSRQVFFVGFGDFDTHGDQNNRQPALLSTLSNALGAFNNAMNELNMASQVTTFTLSDFGRTLTSNGDGTDHAWGGHQLIMGGAVNGGNIYGTMPSLNLNSNDDIGEGRLIPTTSIDQYGATLANWFGLPGTDFSSVFPNLHNFSEFDLGFMTPP